MLVVPLAPEMAVRPAIVTAFVALRTNCVDHDALPAGRQIVSPSAALFIAVCTVDWVRFATVVVQVTNCDWLEVAGGAATKTPVTGRGTCARRTTTSARIATTIGSDPILRKREREGGTFG
jgi:hypothetical protein